MAIKSLYKDYFQKSRVFLYPALNIARGGSVTPIETYVAWLNYCTEKDAKLCCLYHLRDDPEFKNFEKSKLLGNKLFHEFKQVEERKGVYVFNYESVIEDWNLVIKGKYSKLSFKHKDKIRQYIGLKSSQLPYIESFLSPKQHFNMYADMLGVSVDLLKEVGELCSKLDIEKETLNISALNLKFNTEKIISL